LASGNSAYANSWINGNLRRFIADNVTETFDFPVGRSTAVRLAQLKSNNMVLSGASTDKFIYSKFTSAPAEAPHLP
jgi:hypothetical protein